MSIIIRLQNLPWSANAADIRRYFAGQSIPEGGVHIVGGEMGDAFIAFSTDEDARLAMAKDGGKIKDMQIKLLLSSRTEMMRVIEQARQQNMVVTQPPIVVSQPPIMTLQQPPRIATSSSDSDRRRGRSPSPHRRSRDRSPTRDRRRSPDDRRMSKRDRSRSPRSNRNFNRDMDRRSDRFRRDDRHYDDSRYRDDRRPRESSVESKKYSDSADHDSRSQPHASEGFRNMQSMYDQAPNNSMAGFYAYGNKQSDAVKNFSEPFMPVSSNAPAQTSQVERNAPKKLLDFPPLLNQNQNQTSSSTYPHEQPQFRGTPFESSVPVTKNEPDPSLEQEMSKSKRRSRFEPEFIPPSNSSHFPTTNITKPPTENQLYSNVTHTPQNYSETRSSWSLEAPENNPWNEKRQAPISKNGDLVQVVPMDIDPLTAESTTAEKETYETLPPRNASPFLRSNVSFRNDDLRKDNQNRVPHVQNDNKVLSMQERVPMSQNDNRVMPMRNDISGRIPPSLTVEVRGLPPDARIDDILDLFQGIPLPAANIRIEANDRGFEKALIRFVSAADFEEALNRNRRFMHERRCELVPCPASEFDSASGSQKSRPKLRPREEDLTVQLRGLPFSCKDDDVVRFFDGLGILDLFVDFAPDGRATGTGFVEFGTEKDFRTALTMNGNLIGHRYITVSVASKEMMAFARGEDYNPGIQPARPEPQHHSNQHFPNNRPAHFSPGQGQSQGRPHPNNPNRPTNQHRPPAPLVNQTRQGSPQTQPRPPPCISLKSLPEGVTNRDIADFLGQVGVMPRAIHIMLRPDKTPSGDAYAEFGGPADMDAALQLNGNLMKGRRILVQPIPFHEMADILGRPSPIPPPPSPGALLRTPGNMERPRRPLLPQSPAEGAFRERPRLEPPNRAPRPRMEPFKGNMEPARSFGSARFRGPRPQRGNRPESRFPPPAAERGIKDFGSPGCVVSIHNLHFQAGLEELLDFFRDYNISKDNIIRRYNDNGQSTGEARVAFQTPRDAQKAVRELHKKQIMGRPLSLMVLN